MPIQWKPDPTPVVATEAVINYSLGGKGAAWHVTVDVSKKYGMTQMAATTNPLTVTLYRTVSALLSDAQIEVEARILAGVCADAATAWQEAHR